MSAVAQVVVYTDKHGYGKPRAAIVKANADTYNAPVPDEGQLAVLEQLDLKPPAPQLDALDAERDEVILHVFGIDRTYTKRAIYDPALGTYKATPPCPVESDFEIEPSPVSPGDLNVS